MDERRDSWRRLDELFGERGIEPRSLNSAAAVPTGFAELERTVVRLAVAPDLVGPLGLTLERIVRSAVENFPDNLYWDFDFLVGTMTGRVRDVGADPALFLESFGDRMTRLLTLFGIRSSICFRYLHDFLYGFDWAKWVQKAPAARAQVGPFDLAFLDQLEHRGHELLRLIATDDAKYHALPDGAYRNPFPFSREPEQEAWLLARLEAHDLIPVAMWDPHARPTWNKPFHRRREQLSAHARPEGRLRATGPAAANLMKAST